MDEKFYEFSERLARNEANTSNIIKSVTDHLANWDRQWLKIDEIERRVTLAEPQIALIINLVNKIDVLEKFVVKVESEKNLWKYILTPLSAIISSIAASYATFKLFGKL